MHEGAEQCGGSVSGGPAHTSPARPSSPPDPACCAWAATLGLDGSRALRGLSSTIRPCLANNMDHTRHWTLLPHMLAHSHLHVLAKPPALLASMSHGLDSPLHAAAASSGLAL